MTKLGLVGGHFLDRQKKLHQLRPFGRHSSKNVRGFLMFSLYYRKPWGRNYSRKWTQLCDSVEVLGIANTLNVIERLEFLSRLPALLPQHISKLIALYSSEATILNANHCWVHRSINQPGFIHLGLTLTASCFNIPHQCGPTPWFISMASSPSYTQL